MPGPPVSIGCVVTLSPGMAGPPDTGTIVGIFQPVVTAGGLPLAVAGSMCTMINSVTGIPYPMVIGPLASSGVRIAGMALVRMGDMIPTPPGILTIVGPPAAPFVIDSNPP
jgi:uncharacterized Zn-binding protein involved in type VI secretion